MDVFVIFLISVGESALVKKKRGGNEKGRYSSFEWMM